MAGQTNFPAATLMPVTVPAPQEVQTAVTPLSASNKHLLSPSLQAMPSVSESKKPKLMNVNDVLRHSSKAATASKGVSISDVIKQLHAACKLTRNTKLEHTMISNLKDPAKYKRTMQFVDRLWTMEERETLANPNLSPNELNTVTKAIEMRCLRELNILEGKPEKPTSCQKAFYLGIALRLQKLDP